VIPFWRWRLTYWAGFHGKGQAMNTLDYSGPERRNYTRVIYKPSQKAELNMDSTTFEVLDINESGIRFLNTSGVKIPKFIHGVLTLLSGTQVEIDGKVEWEQDDEIGLSLSFLIPFQTIENEQRYIILNCD
jgi:hypothetical protein